MHVHVHFKQGKDTKVIQVLITQRTPVHESSQSIKIVAREPPSHQRHEKCC